MNESTKHRSGFVAILGRPNVGKSTLLNNLVGMKVAAVTPKPQTTRTRILGILSREEGQIILVDTPGVHRGQRKALNRYLVDQAIQAIEEVDGVALMVEPTDDPKNPSPDLALLLKELEKVSLPRVVVINKIDTMADRKDLLPLIEAWSKAASYAAIVPISAIKRDGLDELTGELLELLPSGPPLYPDDMLTDRTVRWLAGELVREQLTLATYKEIPYSLAVTVERFIERAERGDVIIHAVIHVERDSQKAIVIGKGGRKLKTVGREARKEISELVGRPVHLKLWVKVEPEWSRDDRGLRKLGYE